MTGFGSHLVLEGDGCDKAKLTDLNLIDRGSEIPKDVNGATGVVQAHRRRVGRPAARTA